MRFLIPLLLLSSALAAQLQPLPVAPAIADSFVVADTAYSGRLYGVSNAIIDGYDTDSVAIDDQFLDAAGRLYAITAITERRLNTLRGTLAPLDSLRYKPSGRGVLFRPDSLGLIPVVSDGNGMISQALQARIQNHNLQVLRARASVAGQDGEDGADGQDGATGPQGEQGIQGPPGADGEDGAQGPTGATGPQGATGPAGPQGIQGEPGEDGEDGATGPQGIQGETGPAGADGATGPPGADGEDGATGAQGPPGEDGANGAPGQDGADGDEITPGADGSFLTSYGGITGWENIGVQLYQSPRVYSINDLVVRSGIIYRATSSGATNPNISSSDWEVTSDVYWNDIIGIPADILDGDNEEPFISKADYFAPDWNTLTDPLIMYFANGGTNGPPGGGKWNLRVFKYSGDTDVTQFAVKNNGNRVASRNREDGDWSSWALLTPDGVAAGDTNDPWINADGEGILSTLYRENATDGPPAISNTLYWHQVLRSGSRKLSFAYPYSGTSVWWRRATSGSWNTQWARFWDSENDGTGSGLDADLLDGYTSGFFYSPINPPSGDGNGVFSGGGTIPLGTNVNTYLRPGGPLGGGRMRFAVLQSGRYYTGWETDRGDGKGFALVSRQSSGGVTESASLQLKVGDDFSTFTNDTWYYNNNDAGIFRGINWARPKPGIRVGITGFVDLPDVVPTENSSTWLVDAGGGNGRFQAISAPKRKVRTTTTTRTSTTLVADPILRHDDIGVGLFRFRIVLRYTGTTTATDLVYSIDRVFTISDFSFIRSDQTGLVGVANFAYTANVTATSAGDSHVVILEGTFHNSIATNDIFLKWGTNGGGGSVSMIRGGTFELEKID